MIPSLAYLVHASAGEHWNTNIDLINLNNLNYLFVLFTRRRFDFMSSNLYDYTFLGEIRALALRLFSEIATLFLNQQQYDPQIQKNNTRKVYKIIADTLMPQYVEGVVLTDLRLKKTRIYDILVFRLRRGDLNTYLKLM